MRAEWGLWLGDDVDEIMAYQMTLAWIRRKRFEAQIIAAEIGRMLFPAKERRWASDAQLAMWGIRVENNGNNSS